ncbi:50S ribosomal protein L25 [Paenibacillus senegalensis]|uniref:50S ribosomal protein L25 n=1 Tax=Paenibacillus senegalensis TaxID=1465766 RepID=UPI00292A4693|nr:50S ribosomal protein L25 [Paenibacillus senegalensis]
MMRACFAAEPRLPMNKSSLKGLRSKGRLPGSIMGPGQESSMIHISLREFKRWIRGAGSRLVDIQIGDSEKIPVLLEGLQRDPVTRDYIHVDFLRVKTDEFVRSRVGITYMGIPKGTKLGGILQTQSSFIEVKALPHQLVSSISVDISELNIGDTLLAENIELPPGTTLLSPDKELLLSILTPKVQSDDTEGESAV